MEATVVRLNMTTFNGAGKSPSKRNHNDENNAKKPAAVEKTANSCAKKSPPASIPVPTLF
jgi:hypothetical protein